MMVRLYDAGSGSQSEQPLKFVFRKEHISEAAMANLSADLLGNPQFRKLLDDLIRESAQSNQKESREVTPILRPIGRALHDIGGEKAMIEAAEAASEVNGEYARTDIDRAFDGIGGWLR